MQVPTIIVYVRHSADCEHKAQGELFQRCNCRKQVRWWRGGKLFRRSAKTRSWTAAEKVRSKIEAQFAGDPTVKTGLLAGAVSDGKTIQQAIDLFITNKRSQGVSQGVIAKCEREMKDFQAFFSRQSKFHVRDINLDDLIVFRGTWNGRYESSLTRQKVQERLRSFLRYCHDSGSLERLPKLSPIKVDEPPTLPLAEDEYAALLKTCAKFNSDNSVSGANKAKKVHALVRLMRHSGLAIRDAVTLERNEIVWDKKKAVHRIVTSRQKTGVHVSIPAFHCRLTFPRN